MNAADRVRPVASPRVVSARREPGVGRPLPAATQVRMGTAFGHDFSSVRVHAGPQGAAVADRLGARAAAVNAGELYFARGEYNPGTPHGDRLIAHELAHVVQQRGGHAAPGGPVDAERAADAAGSAAVCGEPLRFGLRAAPAGVPALQPTSRTPTPAAPTRTWDERLADAQAEPDLARRQTAMTALLREALGPGYTVREAGTRSTTAIAVADFAASPTLNFDVRLESKFRWGSTTRRVGADRGYYFGTDVAGTRTAFVVIGPLALVAGQPVIARATADHELFHATHHLSSTASRDDTELEAWTDEFIHYFLPTYLHRSSWTPLIDYYEGATAAARTAAVNAITAFYNGLPTTAPTTGGRSDQEKFQVWLRRRLGDRATAGKLLVVALSTGLSITARPRTSAPATPPAPAPSTP